MRDDMGQFLLIVGDHNHGFVPTLTKCLDDVLHQSPVPKVKPVKRLVQDKQLGVFDEGPRQEDEALFATRQC